MCIYVCIHMEVEWWVLVYVRACVCFLTFAHDLCTCINKKYLFLPTFCQEDKSDFMDEAWTLFSILWIDVLYLSK